MARQLSEQDIAGLEAALPSGEKPWLLNGDHGNAGGVEFIEVYLSPKETTPALRRGTVIEVMYRNPSASSDEATGWTVLETHPYAQVAIPGRSFDDIQGDQDINRPFDVFGRFDDDGLVRLVQFLRSDPPLTGSEHIQPWPILSLQRKVDDSVQVFSRKDYRHGQVITLRQIGEDWMVVTVGDWVA